MCVRELCVCVYVEGGREGRKEGGREEGVEDRDRIGQCKRDLRDYWEKLD